MIIMIFKWLVLQCIFYIFIYTIYARNLYRLQLVGDQSCNGRWHPSAVWLPLRSFVGWQNAVLVRQGGWVSGPFGGWWWVVRGGQLVQVDGWWVTWNKMILVADFVETCKSFILWIRFHGTGVESVRSLLTSLQESNWGVGGPWWSSDPTFHSKNF